MQDHVASLLKAGKAHTVIMSDEGGFNPDTTPDDTGKDREPMPGYFQLICRCGYQDKTYWGKDHIEELANRHIFSMAEQIRLTPGGANRRPNPKKRGKYR